MPSSAIDQRWTLQFGASTSRRRVSCEFRVWAPNLTSLAVRILGDDIRARFR